MCVCADWKWIKCHFSSSSACKLENWTVKQITSARHCKYPLLTALLMMNGWIVGSIGWKCRCGIEINPNWYPDKFGWQKPRIFFKSSDCSDSCHMYMGKHFGRPVGRYMRVWPFLIPFSYTWLVYVSNWTNEKCSWPKDLKLYFCPSKKDKRKKKNTTRDREQKKNESKSFDSVRETKYTLTILIPK